MSETEHNTSARPGRHHRQFRQTRHRRQPRHLGPVALRRVLLLLSGLVLITVALTPFFNFPRLHYWLAPLAGIYLFLLAVLPRLWLLVLPVATVVMDFTPWTGRFIYNELDLLFFVTLSSGLLYDRCRFRVYRARAQTLTLLAFVVVTALGYSAWWAFVLPPQAGLQNPYYASEYAYKVAKGMVFGLGLVPMWGYLLAVDKNRAVHTLVAGMAVAALCLGVAVLWERGSLAVLLAWPAWYHVVSSLLDLTAAYRVTGLFSDMHTGGETIDGVVLLLLPVTLWAIAWGRTLALRLLGIAGFIALAYVTLVGFTRTTYVGFVSGVVLYALLVYRARQYGGVPFAISLKWLVPTFGAALVAAVLAFVYAGSFGVASFSALLLLAWIASRVALPGRWRHAATLLAVPLIAAALYAHMHSRWVAPSVPGSLAMVLALAVVFVLARNLFRASSRSILFNQLVMLGACIVLPGLFAVALGGYQFNDRLSRVDSDLQTRLEHWGDVVDSSRGGFWGTLLGSGVGSFPARYIAYHSNSVAQVGSFNVARDGRRSVLRLGGGNDLQLGQRVGIEPHTLYGINVRLRASGSGKLVVALCERNQIYASNFRPTCVHQRLRFEPLDDEFQEVSLEMDSGRVGEGRALSRRPTLFSLKFSGPGQVLEIDAVQFSADGFNLLRNGSFRDGLDYWFSYNDFSHLPWHVKNTFLQVWFETGLLGLCLFLALLFFLGRAAWRPQSVDSLVPVYVTGVLTLCVFGLFGSPLDSVRVSWLFYFFLGSGLASLRVRRKTQEAVCPQAPS